MAARGIRNNNPGNIEYGPFAREMGATGSDGRFATFATPEDGIRAIRELQERYQQSGAQSVRERIERWAPPVENQTDAYVTAVAAAMGIDPDTPFDITDPTLGPAFTEALIQHENGAQPYSSTQITSPWGGESVIASIDPSRLATGGMAGALLATEPPVPKSRTEAIQEMILEGMQTAGIGSINPTRPLDSSFLGSVPFGEASNPINPSPSFEQLASIGQMPEPAAAPSAQPRVNVSLVDRSRFGGRIADAATDPFSAANPYGTLPDNRQQLAGWQDVPGAPSMPSVPDPNVSRIDRPISEPDFVGGSSLSSDAWGRIEAELAGPLGQPTSQMLASALGLPERSVPASSAQTTAAAPTSSAARPQSPLDLVDPLLSFPSNMVPGVGATIPQVAVPLPQPKPMAPVVPPLPVPKPLIPTPQVQPAVRRSYVAPPPPPPPSVEAQALMSMGAQNVTQGRQMADEALLAQARQRANETGQTFSQAARDLGIGPSGGSIYPYATGTDSSGRQVTSYEDEYGSVHSFTVNDGGPVTYHGREDSGSSDREGSILCTFFKEQGLLEEQVWRKNTIWANRTYSPAILEGYRLWARPLLRRLKTGRYPRLKGVVWWVVRNWSKGTVWGKCVTFVGLPLSLFLGLTIRVKKWSMFRSTIFRFLAS